MIHINLYMIFYTHVEHSPTKTIYIKYYLKHTHTLKNARQTHTHNDCSRNRVLILVRMEILWEEEVFQFDFKRWQGWAVSKVLWEWIPNVRSKARKGEKAMSLGFVLLDFQHAGVRRRVSCMRRSVDMRQFREVSTETHSSDFILNMFWNGKPVQFFQERCWVVVTGCQENKSCSKVLYFLERLYDRIRCAHEETSYERM